MLPHELKAQHFETWPPLARGLAVRQLDLVRTLPLCFVSLLFRELIEYDWKFPAERDEMDRQLAYLASSPRRVEPLLDRFAQLHTTPELEQMDWVNQPGRFSERLSAHLWASRQMDAFRSAALAYFDDFSAAMPEKPPAKSRAGIVVLGKCVGQQSYTLFRKFRRHGTLFTNTHAENGVRLLLDAVARRAAANPAPYAHWYIEGGAFETPVPAALSAVSYAALEPVRSALATRIRDGYRSRTSPEVLQSTLAAMNPADIGMRGGDAVWNRFALSLFTEGSGTQVFSTTFVQWTAREVLRRAKPVTVFARYAPRLREQSSERLLSGRAGLETDPQGSLIDADMGAWYTWLNLQRLPQSEPPSFLVWFEDHAEAMAVGPAFPAGAHYTARRDLADIVSRLY